MPFVVITRLDQLSSGTPHPFHASGKDLVLCRIEDQVYALDGVCPHVGGPLGHGTLQGRMLVCPWHAWEFDCVTGEHDRNACRLRTYTVKLDNGEVLVDLPDA